MKCTQCNSTELITNVRAIDRGHSGSVMDLSLEIYGDPDAIFFKEPTSLKLNPIICSDCGFVMFNLSKFSLDQIKKNKEKTHNKRVNRIATIRTLMGYSL